MRSDEHGPLLTAVLDAERRADEILSYPLIESYAAAVESVAETLQRPVLVAIGTDGQRLLGAVELLTRGSLEILGWRTSIRGRHVLLVAVAGVSDAEVATTARNAKNQGAKAIHLCAADVAVAGCDEVDSFTHLHPCRSIRNDAAAARYSECRTLSAMLPGAVGV